jgi:PAS domain S-box-containing protein
MRVGPSLSLATRLMLGAAALVAVCAVGLVYLVVEKSREAYLAERGATLTNQARRGAARLGLSMTSVRRDAMVLANLPPVHGIARAAGNQGMDPERGVSIEFWVRGLREVFAAFADANPEYTQIRYIGVAADGRELVRVDATDGRAAVTPTERLQSTGDRDYFQETIRLRAGEVYLSEINLNQEFGKVQVPHVRALWGATPVFARDGELFGVIVVNVDIGPAIDVVTTDLPPGVQAYLANSEGDYLAHPDALMTFGFDLGKRHTMLPDMPGLQVPGPADAGPHPLQTVAARAGPLHVAVERIQLDPRTPERFLLLAYALPDAMVTAQVAGVRNTATAAAAGIGLLLLGVVALGVRRAFAPLTGLTALAERIGKGDYNVALPTQGVGELGSLIRAFRSMLDGISTRERSLTVLRDGIDTMPAGFVIYDDQDRLVMCNQSYRNFYPEAADLLVPGIRFEDILREGLARGRFPAAAGREEEWLADRLRRQREPHGTIEQGLGDDRWVLVTKSHVANDYIADLRIDITERKEAQEALRASEVRYRRLFEAAKDGILILDADTGMIMDVNPFLINLLGYSHEALLRRKIWEVGFFSDIVANQSNFEELQEKGYIRYENKALRTADGRRIEVEFVSNVYLVNAHNVIQCNIRDVTERKAAETERKAAERKIQAQLEHLNLLDHITRAIGKRQDLPGIFQVVVGSLEDSLAIDFGCMCLHEPAANVLRVTSVGAKSEAHAHELAMDERASIGVDNNGLERCLQGQLVYEPDIGELPFPFPERLARGGMRSLVLAPLRSESRIFGVLVAARRVAQGFSSVECEFLRQLSEHVALAARQAQLYGALQDAYDDLRQTQEAVLRQERLRALGQMASGMAHDINNALSPVTLYTESMLETEPNLSEQGRSYLETIQRAVEDVAQTVARMQEFYRQRETQLALTPVALNSIVQHVIDLTRARWSDMPQQRGIMIRVATELAADLPPIMGVASEIREALTNLVLNAVDAMPEGGTLTLRTRFAEQQGAVIVDVADSGIGMDDDARQRCLEPFFTTKGERGTGLGLAMVFGMVQRHSADIEVDSAPGSGTTMRLIFAAAPALAAGSAEHPAPMAAAAVPSRLRLLLIDDDPILLRSLRNALETDGHVIATANGGQDGIAMLQANLERGEPFAAVITDLGMPYVDGRRVAAAVKQASPATPVILLTGWGDRLAAEGDSPPYVDRLLAKPPRLRELRAALAELCRPAA